MTQHWTLGGAFQNFGLFVQLIEILKFVDNPDYEFSVFDSLPGLLWEEGRFNQKSFQLSKEDFARMVRWYNEQGIGVNLVFSNSLITEKHLTDLRGIFCLETCHSELNGIILLNEVLAQHIRDRYPKYKLIYSVSHAKRDPDVQWFQDKLDRYDLVVLPVELAQEDFLCHFRDLSRFEVIVNEHCLWGCRFQALHYRIQDKLNIDSTALERNSDFSHLLPNLCKLHYGRLTQLSKEELLSLKTVRLSLADIQALKKLGLSRWKLAGRNKNEGADYILFHDINSYLFQEMNIPYLAWMLSSCGLFDKKSAPLPSFAKNMKALIADLFSEEESHD